MRHACACEGGCEDWQFLAQSGRANLKKSETAYRRLAFQQRQSPSPVDDNFDQIAYAHKIRTGLQIDRERHTTL